MYPKYYHLKHIMVINKLRFLTLFCFVLISTWIPTCLHIYAYLHLYKPHSNCSAISGWWLWDWTVCLWLAESETVLVISEDNLAIATMCWLMQETPPYSSLAKPKRISVWSAFTGNYQFTEIQRRKVLTKWHAKDAHSNT